ncbi:hypothetical protein [Ornithinimicrobium cryptoxanthini]|uniref:Uncharacterized protein n=1 Tax=Ornithinimicrobium cryptoxanthini TaxID=2934161 RepID=A0ABY4YLY8_9MICO|nr:hypothetical protein [Ornithinimicrobium cryptoxanthini]USQ77797.1 hypothetical protein NF557_07860 [Ornithinimicrobium cryptoxanthini]
MQQDRLRNPHPWTYEIPVAILLLLVLVTVLGIHTGRAVANLAAGAGWAWPPTTELFSSLPGLLSGDAGAGLSDPGVVASPRSLRVWVVATQGLNLIVCLTLSALAFRAWGPGRLRGMANRTQAAALLGLPRLRKHRAIIRPDLYGNATR